jgi:hypothetical protein
MGAFSQDDAAIKLHVRAPSSRFEFFKIETRFFTANADKIAIYFAKCLIPVKLICP